MFLKSPSNSSVIPSTVIPGLCLTINKMDIRQWLAAPLKYRSSCLGVFIPTIIPNTLIFYRMLECCGRRVPQNDLQNDCRGDENYRHDIADNMLGLFLVEAGKYFIQIKPGEGSVVVAPQLGGGQKTIAVYGIMQFQHDDAQNNHSPVEPQRRRITHNHQKKMRPENQPKIAFIFHIPPAPKSNPRLFGPVLFPCL